MVLDINYLPASPTPTSGSFEAFLASDSAAEVLSGRGFLPRLAVAPIAITGMHRSGTSMITRALHDSGLRLLGTGADQLIEAADDNPEGFWENKAIVDCNEELLEATGGAWDNPPLLPPARSTIPASRTWPTQPRRRWPRCASTTTGGSRTRGPASPPPTGSTSSPSCASSSACATPSRWPCR